MARRLAERSWVETGRTTTRKPLAVPVAATLALAVVAALLCWAVYVSTERSFYEATAAHTLDAVEIMRDLGTESLDTRIRGLKADVRGHAAEQGAALAQAADDAELGRVLSAIHPAEAGLDCWFLASDGRLVGADGEAASWDAVMPPADPLEALSADDALLMGPAYNGERSYIMAVAAPIVVDGQAAGALVERIDGYRVSDWIANLRFKAGYGSAYLIDGTGRNIAASREENYDWFESEYNATENAARTGDAQDQGVAALEQLPLQGARGMGSYEWEGGTSYMAYGPLEEADWALFVGFYGNELERYARDAASQSNGPAQASLALLVAVLGAIALFSVRGLRRQRAANRELVSQKEQIERQAQDLLVSEERFKVAMEKTGNIVVDFDVSKGDVLCFTTPEDAKHCDPTPEGLRRCLVGSGEVEDESLQLFLDALDDVLHGAQRASCMLEVRGTAGEKLWYRASLSPVAAGEGGPLRVIGVLEDVTKEREAEYDDLTGLLDRKAAFETVQEWLDAAGESSRCAFAMVDVDRFKEVNDTYGHAAGDEALRWVADVLGECCGGEAVVARYGGDEFCLFCREAPSREHMSAVFDEVNRRLGDGRDLGRGRMALSCSFGAVEHRGAGAAFEQLQAEADEALYRAKAAGRRTHAFFDEAPKDGEAAR
ncbi:sensor domain-containing diguanylate cyclase [Arabiibacter massiliensis]|uniref:sensor domain-containing diguanylate cyclase n=1 Tax=Arabiibacter massiliensis TaxID=1870985 RepID=UPI00117BB2D3|nr:diguanylate cyclase [Arabiibacter massiliensis]